MGRAIKYEEFSNIVLGKHNDDDSSSYGSQRGLKDRKKSMGKFAEVLSVACTNTTQQLMVDEHLVKYKCLPPPFFMISVTLAQIIVYIVYTSKSGWYTDALDSIASQQNELMYYPNRRHEAWRYISYWLLHQGFIDLIFNVVLQIVLGVPLEIMFSWWRMAIVWCMGILAGSLGHSLTDHYEGLAGAAGGAYAIMAAHCLMLWTDRTRLNDDLTHSRNRRILCSLPLRICFMLLIFIPQVSLAVYRRWFLDPIHVRVGIAAHISGLLAGLVIAEPFLKDIKRLPWQDRSGFMALFIFLMFVGGTVIFNIVYNGYPEEVYI
ncbi:unnamed protein product [Lymnaea stagnalis]|uniref:Peptidase S54 rhomboid domain-containing protein n=1 Tax=Lymnaea stagnalis TaxID=6523 RepID=A0AAV2HUL7_LYMST